MHPATQPSFIEDALISVLQNNAALVIPILLLCLKLIIRIVAGKDEVYRHILPLPTELLFIGIGIITAGLARSIPAFAKHYGSDRRADLAGAIIIVALCASALFLTWLNTVVQRFWQRFQVAIDRVRLPIEQPGYDFRNPPASVDKTMAWGLAYFMFAIIIWGGELAFSVFLLWQVFLRIQGGY